MTGENSGRTTAVSVSQSDSSSNTGDDEVSTIHEINEDYESEGIDLPGFGASNHPSTVVNMTDSSNVQIKTTTQFYAPVTIHQYSNRNIGVQHLEHGDRKSVLPSDSENCTESSKNQAKLAEESGSCGTTANASKRKLYHALTSNLTSKLGIIFILTAAVVTVAVIVYFTMPKTDDRNHTLEDVPKNQSSNVLQPGETDYDLGNDIHIFTRNRWGGRDIQDGWQNRTLVHPIKLVIVSHTVTPQCTTIENCSARLQTIQSDHVGRLNYLDIGYNFLVGGDGNIYQAYGWDIRNHLMNNSIQISFIGNYVYDTINDRQRKAVQRLLVRGVELGKLDKNYLLVAHNQVQNTLSPGKTLLAEIKLWSHYSNQTFT